MNIGIVSDTHGRVDRLRLALDMFAGRSVQAVVHCGDIGSPECLEALADLGVPAYAVGGNMDDRTDALPRLAERTGVTFAWSSLAFLVAKAEGTAENTFAAVTHGDDPRRLAELVNDPDNRFVFHGHTHCQRDEHVDRGERAAPVHIINPGALYKPRHPAQPTVAVLDTETDAVEFLDV